MPEHRDNPELRDLQYELACRWCANYRELSSRLASGVPRVSDVVASFITNLDRIDSLNIQRSDTGLKIRGKPRCRQRLVLKPIPWVEPPKRLRARL
jgi:hypothetical protein